MIKRIEKKINLWNFLNPSSFYDIIIILILYFYYHKHKIVDQCLFLYLSEGDFTILLRLQIRILY